MSRPLFAFRLAFLSLVLAAATASPAATSFNYSLPRSATTSAGVYSSTGVLVRTLWFNQPKQAGANTAAWDDLDDAGKPAPPGNYEIRVLFHNMQYHWDGVVGNNSLDPFGTTIHKGMYPLQDIAITGTKAFYTTGYNEAMYDFHRFDTAHPRTRLDSWTWVRDTRSPAVIYRKLWDCYGPCWSFVATDATHVYFASPEGWETAAVYKLSPGYVVASNVSDDTQPGDVFAHGIELPDLGTPYVFPLGIRVGTKPGISGMAVQQNGNLLAVAVAPDNRVYLIDKLSGDVLSQFDVTKPRRMTFDAKNDLWIAAGPNVYRYTIQSAAPYTATLAQTIPGFSNALAVGVNPKADRVVVADGGESMQIKAFKPDGKPKWTYGQAGGYQKNGPAVTDDKLWFFSSPNAIYSTPGANNTFITFQPDGTFWVGDGMNARTLLFSDAKNKPHVIDRIEMQPMSYLIGVDRGDATHVFRNFLEFKIDYSKPLGPDNGSWKLANNWAANLPTSCAPSPDNAAAGIANVATLSNGRTYALIPIGLVELTPTGIRPTGSACPGGELMEDGSLFQVLATPTNGSFETGDNHGWSIWTSGNPATYSAKAETSPAKATDGTQYLDIQAAGPTTAGTVAVTLGSTRGVAFAANHTFNLSFDVQNKTQGFDRLGISLIAVDSKGQITSTAETVPAVGAAMTPDGAWHSYQGTITLPPVATEYSAELRLTFIKNVAEPGKTYQVLIDNIKFTRGPEKAPIIDHYYQRWYRAPLTGFDKAGNPQWGPSELVASIVDPMLGTTSLSPSGPAALTASGVVAYEPSLRNVLHLGGVARGETAWAWKAFPSTDTKFSPTASYPIGYYDLGTNHRVYTGGGKVVTSGRHIIAGYHGEGWGRCQGNQFMHFYDDGLFIGQFGVPGTDANGNKWAPDYSKAGYAGNSFCPALANDHGELYLYMNDEWGTPLQRFHLIGANDVREISGVGTLDSTIKLNDAK